MYNLKDLSMITGLTDRTLRNYLSMGILAGEKADGAWQFNAEQIRAFLENDFVSQAMKAKRNAVLFDYLKYDGGKKNTACIVLRLREEDPGAVSAFFCNAVNKRTGLTMTFDRNKGENKVVLVGDEETVYDVLAEYRAARKPN